MNGEQGTRTETEDKRLASSYCTVHCVMQVSFTVILMVCCIYKLTVPPAVRNEILLPHRVRIGPGPPPPLITKI